MWRRSPNPTGVGLAGLQAGRPGYAGEVWAFLFGAIKTGRAFKPVQPSAGKISHRGNIRLSPACWGMDNKNMKMAAPGG
jgi:hypothetical protein